MLEALAVEGGATSGGPEQKALCLDVAGQPHQIADALKPEHRVIDVEWNRVTAMRGVGGAGRDECGHRTGLSDSFFENLAIFGFVIVEQ